MYNNYLPMYEYLLDHNPQCSNDGGDEPKPNTKARNAVTMKQIVRRLSRRPTIGFFLIIIYAIVQIGRSNYRLFQVNPTDSSVSSSIGNNLISARKQYTDKKPLTALPPLVLTPGPIFYNIFIPSIEDNDLSRIKQILQEQFIQRNETSPNATIMYTLIGSDSATSFRDKIMVDGMCQPHCKLREHLPNGGDEVHTLQAVWNYCQSAPQNSSHDTLVSYIHDKGSFHPTPANDKARRMATKAALECRNLLLTSKNPRVCTICCGAFHVLPQYLASAK